ncbi:MAG TPA: PQQ-binding-like beta-propeller repeat protein [Candidatus Margulisiibacteriota bacterium]|nr:PQQ-binding-like beta-propeller repeat protein [Candidatus Margulisiibacteriota bacterium]
MRCAKSHAMNVVRVLMIMLLLGVCACSGGGGGGAPAPVPAWEKFRRDTGNSGQGNGTIADNTGLLKWETQIDNSPISSSPAIDIDGTLHVATEGGTLAALAPATGTIDWVIGGSTPVTCPRGTYTLGPLISSPAVYTFGSVTNIMIGSARGAVYVFQDNGTTQTCTGRFEPNPADFDNATITSQFNSSPTFTTNPSTLAIASIVIGAAIDVTQGGATRTVGKLYALNTDGTLIWQFPKVGARAIGAVTSSPALGSANEPFFTAADGYLYALANDGSLKWRFPIGEVVDPRAPFSASPLVSDLLFVPSATGNIFAVNPDGAFRWRVSSPDGTGFVSSLAAGPQATTTPSLTPTIPSTPTPPPGATATPTPTATPPFPNTTLFGVTTAGAVVLIDTNSGLMKMLTEPAASIAGPVISSPLLSSDGYLVVGSADGILHAINTFTGEQPSGWPVTLAAGIPIRSSPAIDNNGNVYVGNDRGIVYAVGSK